MPDFLLRKDSGELELVSGSEPLTVTPNAGAGRYDVYRLDNSTSVTLSAANEDTAPDLTDLAVTTDGTTATLRYATNAGSGGVYWVLTASGDVPDTWRIKRAEDHAGSPALANGYQRVSDAGEQPDIVVSDLPAGGTCHFHMYHRADGETSAVASATVTIEAQEPADTTAPVLADVSASITGNSASLNWSTDEGNGVGYWVCTASATMPSEAQIIAGQDQTGNVAVASGSHGVTNQGAQPAQFASGLTEGRTYFFHLVQRDASLNASSRYSTTGVTVASSGVSAQIGIVHRSVTEVAPEGIVFDLTLSGFDTPEAGPDQVYNPQYHELYYFWDFGDAYDFEAPENLIAEHLSSRKAYGPKVSHTYRAPGTYTVRCEIVEPDSGKTVTAERRVTIGDPETLFAGTRTVYVDQNHVGNRPPAGAPSGARVVRSIEEAWSAVYSGYETNYSVPRRIMIARGQSFAPHEFWPMGINSAAPSVLVCASPGDGAKPVIDTVNANPVWANTFAGANSVDVDFKMQDIEWVGPWDVTTQSGQQQEWMNIYENRPKQFLVDRCEFRGYNIAIYPIFADRVISPDPYFVVNDTVITDYRSSCLFGDANWAGTGNRIVQNPDALCGYAGSENNLISCVRFGRAPNVIWHQNDMFSRTSWFSNVPGIYSLQSCFRGNTASLPGAFYNVNCNVFEGGVASFSIDIDDTNTSNPINAVVEKNITIGYHDSYRAMEFGFGGITVRNNVCIIPDGERYGMPLNQFLVFKRRIAGGDNTANRDAPIQVYNNTFVCLVSSGNVSGGPIPLVHSDEGYTDVTVRNNVSHQPNRGGGVANLDDTVLWPPRYTHYEDDNTPRDDSKATPLNTIALYSPEVGSEILGDALNDPIAYDDFFGEERPQYPSIGALEVIED